MGGRDYFDTRLLGDEKIIEAFRRAIPYSSCCVLGTLEVFDFTSSGNGRKPDYVERERKRREHWLFKREKGRINMKESSG